jgi:hypothetical protein
VGKNKIKTFKFHFDFVHFVIVLIFLLPLSGEMGQKENDKFYSGKSKMGKKQCGKKTKFSHKKR